LTINDDIRELKKTIKNLEIKNEIYLDKIQKYENEISELKSTIDSVIQDAKRAIELNSKVTESEYKLKQINAQKDKFFSILAHDLRNPIANFKELAKILAENHDVMKKKEKIALINNLALSSKQLYELLENLLEWSRCQTDRIPYNPNNYYLIQLVDANIQLLMVNASQKNIDLVVEPIEDLVVFVDEKMINTVIRNLISNAIKFTPEFGEIRLYAEKKDDNVQLTIADTGVGIPPENIENLFKIDVFTSTVGTNQEKGTGLGLVLCKEFLITNGGSIEVESVLNKGSKFIITLPSQNPESDSPIPYVPVKVQSKLSKKKKTKEKIIIEELSNDIINKLPDLLDKLKNEYQDYYNEASETLIISSVIEFSDKLLEFAEKEKFDFLKNYSNLLKEYAEDLELDKMNKMLEKYPKILQALKDKIV